MSDIHTSYVQALINQHDDETQKQIGQFTVRVRAIRRRIETSLLVWLLSQLQLKNGVILATKPNLQVFLALPDKVTELSAVYGLDAEIAKFTAALSKQKDFAEQIIEATGQSPVYRSADNAFFEAYRKAKGTDLRSEVSFAAERLVLRAELTIGAPVTDLGPAISTEMDVLLGRLRAVATTSASMLYRAVSSQGYRLIEATGKVLRYVYMGPPAGDPKIRPFCKALMSQVAAGATWTRAEIDAMDNHQLPNCFVSGGGINCRHSWIATSQSLAGQSAE